MPRLVITSLMGLDGDGVFYNNTSVLGKVPGSFLEATVVFEGPTEGATLTLEPFLSFPDNCKPVPDQDARGNKIRLANRPRFQVLNEEKITLSSERPTATFKFRINDTSANFGGVSKMLCISVKVSGVTYSGTSTEDDLVFLKDFGTKWPITVKTKTKAQMERWNDVREGNVVAIKKGKRVRDIYINDEDLLEEVVERLAKKNKQSKLEVVFHVAKKNDWYGKTSTADLDVLETLFVFDSPLGNVIAPL